MNTETLKIYKNLKKKKKKKKKKPRNLEVPKYSGLKWHLNRFILKYQNKKQ